ncbi:hypothetical protein J6590_073800 [Homalodisca vitripennis]|nr:hypothetical protein J6590_073800 [Homalodisca vitripennis]
MRHDMWRTPTLYCLDEDNLIKGQIFVKVYLRNYPPSLFRFATSCFVLGKPVFSDIFDKARFYRVPAGPIPPSTTSNDKSLRITMYFGIVTRQLTLSTRAQSYLRDKTLSAKRPKASEHHKHTARHQRNLAGPATNVSGFCNRIQTCSSLIAIHISDTNENNCFSRRSPPP